MKRLLGILGVVSLTATGTSSVISCNNPNINYTNADADDYKILEENINKTSLENIANSTKTKKSEKAENKIYEFQNKENEYQNKFETDSKDINFQLWQLFSLRKEEAFYKTHAIQFGKLSKLPPAENDVRRHLYKQIEQVKKGYFNFEGKEYKINHLIIKLANNLENKYYK